MARMTVYHGGYVAVERPEIRIGREDRKDNDLFFTCSLIDYIARKTKNTRSDVVTQLGKERLQKIYDLADVYHCDNIERVSDDFIREAQIGNGTYDNVGECKYAIPSHWDIGKVYKRLIKQVAQSNNPLLLIFIQQGYLLPVFIFTIIQIKHKKSKISKIMFTKRYFPFFF